MARPSRRRVAWLFGVVAVVVTLGGILTATVLSPSFVWTADALSELGTDPTTAWLFNASLVSGAVLAFPYAWALWAENTAGGRAAGDHVRAGAFAVAVISMAGVGLFPIGSRLHDPAAVSFFLSSTTTLIADGLARGRTRTGSVSLILGVLIPVVWAGWAVLRLGPGIAVPEFVGVVLFGGWVVVLSPLRPDR